MTRKPAGIVGVALLLSIVALVALQTATSAPDAVLPDGSEYFGSVVNGRFEGDGTLEWPNGARYEGGFRHGLFSGRGRYRFADGAVYEGEFADGMMAGTGRMELPDGSVYTGEFRRDLFNGKGRHENPDGSFYEGEFKDDYYWGEGELHYVNGDVYRGMLVRGQLHGHGRYERADGAVYEGDFADDTFTGKGTYTDDAGASYTGDFQDWVFHGKGAYTDPAGDVYQGTFSDGSLNGEGRYTGRDGSRYEGGFQYGQFHGKGKYWLANGDVYEGSFRYGQFHGEGTLTYAEPKDERRKLSGKWRYGQVDDPERELRTQHNVEAALYGQPALLEQSLARVKVGEPGKAEMYLLAVGGDGSQEVFRREVEFVKSQFDRDFGTAERSLALVNSRTTVDTLPMATVTSIRRALDAFAERMNKDEDILFLFLTSHGSQDHRLVLGQNGMSLRNLPAVELADLLAASGIRWKVVVVSACYSGGFIEPLKNDGTLIITAARHDRTSFGCADDNDFTYFGRAFFQESLPQAASFVEAFDKAESLVRGWEEDEDQRSLPQIHRAPAVEAQLQRWREALLRAAPTTAQAE